MSEEQSIADLSGVANKKLGEAFNVVKFIYWAGSIATVSIVTSTIFIIRAADAISFHDKCIRLIWIQTFGTPLP